MAFSSISQAGYIMLALLSPSAASATALNYYILIYIVANLVVFGILSTLESTFYGDITMSRLNGFYRTNPRLSFIMTLALFSLGGIPPFAGMFSKFFVFMAALQGQELDTTMGTVTYVVVFIALVNTVVSLYYYLLIVKAMYINRTEEPLPTFVTPERTRISLALCTSGIVLFGIISIFYNWIFNAVIA